MFQMMSRSLISSLLISLLLSLQGALFHFGVLSTSFMNVIVASEDINDCPCGKLIPRPDLWDKALTARWMVRTLDWGVLTTISSRQQSTAQVPFGNVYSFVDGSCINSTGTPYFYGTYMDQSFQDMKENSAASFTLTEASLKTDCADTSTTEFVDKACVISVHNNHDVINNNNKKKGFPGDPENPVCARLTMTGNLVEVSEDTDEYNFVQAAFFERHPQMQYWPTDHQWKIAKLNLQEVWLIDYFGGATILTPQQYYENDPLLIQTLATANDIVSPNHHLV